MCPPLPTNNQKNPIVISGEVPLLHPSREYLLWWEEGECVSAYKIRYDVHTGPFKEACFLGLMLGVGYEEYFYLFNTEVCENLLTLPMQGYFGHLYIAKDSFYVADTYSLYRIDATGRILWHNNSLGIDGVLIDRFGLYSADYWINYDMFQKILAKLTQEGCRHLLTRHLRLNRPPAIFTYPVRILNS